jgi:NAD(P)H-dependent FMN reductase
MKNILVIAGTTHRASINLALAGHAASLVEGGDVTRLDLNDFEMPLFSEDREDASGIPQAAKDFLAAIQGSDGIILSLAEHNGAYSAAFKNVLDWTSRIETKLWSDKPMLLMATSPGGRGGANVLGIAENYLPHLGARVVASFSLPSFYDNFVTEEGIKDEELQSKFSESLQAFQKALA